MSRRRILLAYNSIINAIQTIPTNEIWYISTDGNVVTPYATDVFGANIVSNTYSNGKGIIKFDGNVTKVGMDAFYGCTSLKSLAIGNSVTTIGGRAFTNCDNLTSITIPDSVTEIGSYAFYGCSSLTSVTIPDSVTYIRYEAFNPCTSLLTVYCRPTTTPGLGGTSVFNNNATDRKIYVPYQSLDAYKTATGWSEYADDIVGYDYENNKVYYPDSTTFEFPLYINVTDFDYENDSSIEYSKSNSITDELWQWCQNKYAEGYRTIDNPNIYINGNRITSMVYETGLWLFYWENMEDNWYGIIEYGTVYIGMNK